MSSKGNRTGIRLIVAKIIRWLLALSAAMMLLFSGLVFYITQWKEDEVCNLLINYLEKNTGIRATFSTAELSVWSDFPSISIVLHNITVVRKDKYDAQAAFRHPDSLLVAGHFRVEVSLREVLFQKISLKRIHLENGWINLVTNRKNRNNYDVLPSEDSSGESGSRTSFSLRNIRLLYDDQSLTIKTVVQISSAHIALDRKQNAKVKGRGHILLFGHGNSVLTGDYPATLRLRTKNDLWLIDNLSWTDSKGSISLSGQYADKNHYAFRIRAEEFAAGNYIRFLNNAALDSLAASQPEATMQLDLSLQCESSVYLQINDLQYKSEWFEASLNGHYTAADESILYLTGKLDARKKALSLLLPGNQWDIEGSLGYSGDIAMRWKNNFTNLRVYITQGEALCNQLSIADHTNHIELNGKITIKDNKLTTDSLRLSFNRQLSWWNIRQCNLNDLQTDQARLGLEANVRARQILWREFLAQPSTTDTLSTSNDSSNYQHLTPSLPSWISLTLNFSFQQIKLAQGDLKNATGTLIATNTGYQLRDFRCSAFGGTFSADAQCMQYKTAAQFSVSKADLGKIMLTFDHFGQHTLRADQLSGQLTARGRFTVQHDSSFAPRLSTLKGEADYTLQNGQIRNFEPLYHLSSFCRMSQLHDFEFSDLKGNLLVNEGIIRIPQTEISTNAFSMTLSGNHSLTGEFLYSIKVYPVDALLRKMSPDRKALTDQNRRKGLYLLAEGTPNQYHIRFDKEKIRELIEWSYRQEASQVEETLHDLPFWSANDTLIAE